MGSLSSSPGCGKHTGEILSVNWDSGGENLGKQIVDKFWKCLVREYSCHLNVLFVQIDQMNYAIYFLWSESLF